MALAAALGVFAFLAGAAALISFDTLFALGCSAAIFGATGATATGWGAATGSAVMVRFFVTEGVGGLTPFVPFFFFAGLAGLVARTAGAGVV